MKRLLAERGDLLGGVVLLVVGLAFLYEARHLPFGTLRAPAAGFFPVCLSTTLAALGALIAARSLWGERSPPVEFQPSAWHIAVTVVAFVFYALFVETLGYLPITLAIMLLLLIGFGRVEWKRAILIASLIVFPAYALFIELGVPLPRGIMPF